MAKRRELDYRLDEDRYDPHRFPFACLPATKPSATSECGFCNYKARATTVFEAALCMVEHQRYHQSDAARLEQNMCEATAAFATENN